MTHIAFAWAGLLAAQALAVKPPQQATPGAIEPVVGLSAHFRDLHTPSVSSYATASLAVRVCPLDKNAAEKLFIDAIRDLNALPESAFTEATDLLPVTSFAALYRFIATGAKRCEPALASHLAAESIRIRIEQARQNASANLSAASSIVDSNPDRSAQLAAAALGASTPEQFDLRTMVSLLCRLRERAPDLADDLFEQALEFEAGAALPDPGALDELARYLFVANSLRELPDKEGRALKHDVAGYSFTDLGQLRHSTNPDSLATFIAGVTSQLNDTGTVSRSPVGAYALAYQLLPKVKELVPDLSATLEHELNVIGAIAANYTGQVIAAISTGGGSGVRDAEIDPDRKRDRLVAKVLAAWKEKQFDAARDTAMKIDDLTIRSQLYPLIDFGRAVAAAERRDTGAAFAFSGSLQAGVKRAIAYVSTAAAENDKQAALEVLKLAARDVDVLPSEFRASLLAVIAKIGIRMENGWGYAVLNRSLEAVNEASAKPRKTIFDPRSARKTFNSGIDTSTDVPFVLRTRRGFYEVVDSEYSRHSFPLKGAGVKSFDLQSIFAGLDAADAEPLRGMALNIRDDTKRVSALLGLADLMIRNLKPAVERPSVREENGPN